MRKPRIIIYDDEVQVRELLTDYFSMMDYEVISFSEPVVCPIYKKISNKCNPELPCADIIMTDFRMPKVNGIELFKQQSRRGCKVAIHNKAIMSGYLESENLIELKKMGCPFFPKPFDLKDLMAWAKECESHFDLSRQLGSIDQR
jgi:DNA-binding NtrC family response regulator